MKHDFGTDFGFESQPAFDARNHNFGTNDWGLPDPTPAFSHSDRESSSGGAAIVAIMILPLVVAMFYAIGTLLKLLVKGIYKGTVATYKGAKWLIAATLGVITIIQFRI